MSTKVLYVMKFAAKIHSFEVGNQKVGNNYLIYKDDIKAEDI